MANETNHTSISYDSTSPLLDGNKLVAFIFLAFLIFFTLFGNVLVCLAICRTRRLRTPSNILIVNMAIGDIFYSISTLPLAMVLLCFRSNWPLGKLGNIFFDAIWFSFLILSFMNVVVIAFERFIAITKPFTYKKLITKRCVVKTCLGCWLYVALVIAALTFSFREPPGDVYLVLIRPEIYYVMLMFHASLPFVLVPYFYAKIYTIAKKHKTEILKHEDHKTHRRFHREMKATLTIGLVICLFFIVWLPFLIYQFVDFADIKAGEWDAVNSAMCYITYCNGPINILVYSIWNREIRNAILKLLWTSPNTSEGYSVSSVS